jgi:hypothetical protein
MHSITAPKIKPARNFIALHAWGQQKPQTNYLLRTGSTANTNAMQSKQFLKSNALGFRGMQTRQCKTIEDFYKISPISTYKCFSLKSDPTVGFGTVSEENKTTKSISIASLEGISSLLGLRQFMLGSLVGNGKPCPRFFFQMHDGFDRILPMHPEGQEPKLVP